MPLKVSPARKSPCRPLVELLRREGEERLERAGLHRRRRGAWLHRAPGDIRHRRHTMTSNTMLYLTFREVGKGWTVG